MKVLVNICRVIVGVLFIISGLVKANDPNGLSYKMQEFFEAWHTTFLNPASLWLSVIMIAFEIIAGVALLLGWKKNLMSWLLLLLIIFFTFLTGYAHLSGKFKSCGCFGDCLPITPLQSFLKDVFLLVLVLFLFFKRKYILPFFSKQITAVLMFVATVMSFLVQWYTLHYLPVADCLAFKTGNNIKQQMQMPANAIQDSTVINFVYEKEGKRVEFSDSEFPDDFDDSTYKFISRNDKLIRKGVNNEPPIKIFNLTDSAGNDVAEQILEAPNVLLLFAENLSTPFSTWKNGFEEVYAKAIEKNIPVYIVTGSRTAMKNAVAPTALKNIVLLDYDAVMIRVAARTNPTLYVLQKGTVAGKWSYKNFGKAVAFVQNIKTN